MNMAKTTGNSKKPMTKSEIVASLATETDLTKKEVARILEALAKLIEKTSESVGRACSIYRVC